jgi:hypothetical protein
MATASTGTAIAMPALLTRPSRPPPTESRTCLAAAGDRVGVRYIELDRNEIRAACRLERLGVLFFPDAGEDPKAVLHEIERRGSTDAGGGARYYGGLASGHGRRIRDADLSVAAVALGERICGGRRRE